MTTENLTEAIINFIKLTGINVSCEPITGQTFLPGTTIRTGTLIVDAEKLLYPGDLLHEAGHIAVTPAEQRKTLGEDDTAQFDDGSELAAIAWSYAACRYLNIDPHIVFHEHGYRGAGKSIAANFELGRYMGVPLLDWYGMTNYGDHNPQALVNPYPAMINWLSQK
ncbi:hypothetical protein ACFGVR_13375 [Mucilaginibacter sp. AW1-3]